MQAAVHSQQFHVEGIRCARCIHAIESSLNKEPGVTQARVNMSTNRLSLEWEGADNRWEHYLRVVESLGYKAQPFAQTGAETRQSEDRFLLRCMAIAGFAMGNIMLISVALWSSDQPIMGMATRDLLHWISAFIALPTIAYAGRPFFQSAWRVLRKGHTNMDVPISLAMLLACGMSLYETFHHGEHAYFDSAVMLLFFLLIGRWLDARARGKARENAEGLLSLMQGYATVLEGNTQKKIPISELREGMQLRIAAGERIPTDVEVIDGSSEIDSSLVTGETLPVEISKGGMAYGGTINLAAPLTCLVLKATQKSLLADIIRLMEQAEQGRARYVRLADKAAALYTPVVHSLAALAFIGWYFVGGIAWQDALLIAITTLIITCPCALGLAVPVVQVLATGGLMKRKALVKSGDALERLAAIDTVIFDKTGTLTLGKPLLQNSGSLESGILEFQTSRIPALQLAASLAAHSLHPYSQAISNAYEGELLPLEKVEEIPGEGVIATYQGKKVTLGKTNSEFQNSRIPDSKLPNTSSTVWLQVEGESPVDLTFTDTLKEDAKTVVETLTQHGLEVHLLSGDRKAVAKATAEELNIVHWQAEMLPGQKTEFIKALQQKGHKVLMVGDGLNDAPSLAQADISLSPASGIDITQNSADIVFQGDHLRPVLQAWNTAKFSTRLAKQNFGLAVLYNCFAIPLAVAGYVTPLIAAIAMSSSSLIVIANSFRLNLIRE